MKKNILKYFVTNKSYGGIGSAKNFIPDWYKNGTRLDEDEKKIKRFPTRPGFKLCQPFFESFATGYMLTTPVDIAVEQTEIGPAITWREELKDVFLQLRENDYTNKTLPTPEGFSNLHFAWMTKISLKIPKGYSMLFTHPLNRFDLPFQTLSAVIDGEFCMYHNGSVPVFFNKTFEGVIPKGTPFAQIILFKTESWQSEFNENLSKEANDAYTQSCSVSSGWYKKNIWKRKNYA